MGKTKEMVMDFHDNSDEYINEQIQLKLNTEHQYYINLYGQDIDEELNELRYENKN
jgi:hypothetical protein